MKYVWLTIGIFIHLHLVTAAELCENNETLREGNQILVCGQGLTREAAMKDAKTEFQSICDASSDCMGHEVTLLPKRESCTKKGCERIVQFTIGPKTSGSLFIGHKAWIDGLDAEMAMRKTE